MLKKFDCTLCTAQKHVLKSSNHKVCKNTSQHRMATSSPLTSTSVTVCLTLCYESHKATMEKHGGKSVKHTFCPKLLPGTHNQLSSDWGTEHILASPTQAVWLQLGRLEANIYQLTLDVQVTQTTGCQQQDEPFRTIAHNVQSHHSLTIFLPFCSGLYEHHSTDAETGKVSKPQRSTRVYVTWWQAFSLMTNQRTDKQAGSSGRTNGAKSHWSAGSDSGEKGKHNYIQCWEHVQQVGWITLALASCYLGWHPSPTLLPLQGSLSSISSAYPICYTVRGSH